jgi:hypothetical protein
MAKADDSLRIAPRMQKRFGMLSAWIHYSPPEK